MPVCLLLMCGIPASGKTTTCNALITALPSYYHIYVLSFDALARTLQSTKKHLTSLEVWRLARELAFNITQNLASKHTNSDVDADLDVLNSGVIVRAGHVLDKSGMYSDFYTQLLTG